MEGGFERNFSVLPSEKAEAEERAIAAGISPEKAVADLRAKAEQATARTTEASVDGEAERAVHSLEKAFEAAWTKMTPEQKEKLRSKYFQES